MLTQATAGQPAGYGRQTAMGSRGKSTLVTRLPLANRLPSLQLITDRHVVRCAHDGHGGGGPYRPPGGDGKRHSGLGRQARALIRGVNDTLGVRPFRDLDQIRNIKEREIGGRLWLLLLSFYGVYYAAYLYLVYKILQSLPGVMPALEHADDKAGWLLGALLDVGLWPWLAAALLLYIKAGLGRDEGGGDQA